MSTSTIGSFANAAAADYPPDDASKSTILGVDPNARAPEKPIEKSAVEKPVEKSVEKVAEKSTEPEKKDVVIADDLSNPNLGGEPAKKKEETTEDLEKKPAGMTEKVWVDWKAIKTERNTAKQERDAANAKLAETEKQLAEARKTAPDVEAMKKELEDSKKRLADYENEISVTRVEATQKFKQSVTDPIAAVTNDMEALAKRYEVEPATLMRAIAEIDPAKRAELLDDAIGGFRIIDQQDVAVAVKDYQRAQRAAAELRQDASKRLEEITRETTADQEKQANLTAQDYRDAVGTHWETAQTSIPELRAVAGHDKWNAHLDSIKRSVEGINVNELPVEEVAKMAVSHKLMPELRAVATHFKKQVEVKDAAIAAITAEKEKLEKQLAGYLKTAPGAGAGNGSGNGSGDKGGGSRSGSFADAVLA